MWLETNTLGKLTGRVLVQARNRSRPDLSVCQQPSCTPSLYGTEVGPLEEVDLVYHRWS